MRQGPDTYNGLRHNSTLLPQVTGIAATGNLSLVSAMAEMMLLEGRALSNLAQEKGVWYPKGATVWIWSPTSNMGRDPRWGRLQESIGMDPYLNSAYATNFIQGIQGKEEVVAIAATTKHFIGYSLEDSDGVTRHTFVAKITPQDLNGTYFPNFHGAVTVGLPRQVMCSYNSLEILTDPPSNATPSCLYAPFITGVLREKWGFDGIVVSDQDCIHDAYASHHYSANYSAATAGGFAAGCDLNDGVTYAENLASAVEEGLVGYGTVQTSARRVMLERLRTGLYDQPGSNPYVSIPPSVLDSSPHRALALQAARESVALLVNRKGVLPLNESGVKVVAVVGPMGDESSVMMGAKDDYRPSFILTLLDGLQNLLGGEDSSNVWTNKPNFPRVRNHPQNFTTIQIGNVQVRYAEGCTVSGSSKAGFAAAVAAAKGADVVIHAVGIDGTIEGEQKDRTEIDLPGVQSDLVTTVFQSAPNANHIATLFHGGPLSADWVFENMDTIVDVFEGGQSGGQAAAEVLFGRVNPSGVSPYFVPTSNYTSQVSMTNMSMQAGLGRSYRFYTGPTLAHFGQGGSFTTFTEQWSVPPPALAPVELAGALDMVVNVTNTGRVPGARVVMAFAERLESASAPSNLGMDASDPPYAPFKSLFGIQKVFLNPGQSQLVHFSTSTKELSVDARLSSPRRKFRSDYDPAFDASLAPPPSGPSFHSQNMPKSFSKSELSQYHQRLQHQFCTLCDVLPSGRRVIRPGSYLISIGTMGKPTSPTTRQLALQTAQTTTSNATPIQNLDLSDAPPNVLQVARATITLQGDIQDVDML